MNNRFWRGLLLLVAMLTPSRIATAQKTIIRNSFGATPRQSHHDLPDGLDLDNPQEMMAQRLRELQELHQLQDQVQGLLKDPEFLQNLRRLSEPELRQLREKLLRGEGLGQNPGWEKLLKQAASRQKLDQRQIDILRRWVERSESRIPPPSETGLLNGRSPVTPTRPPSAAPDSSAPAPSVPPAEPAEPSLLDRMQEETTKWMIDHLDDVGADVLNALREAGTADEGTPLAELLRSMQQPDFSGLNVSERAMGLSRHLPNVGAFLHEQRGAWDEVRSIFQAAPSLPNFGNPSTSASATGSSDSWAPALLSLLLLGMLVLLLCKMTARSQAQAGSDEAQPWRLGDWPVAPDAVSTRQDIIRAFEYLALLRLGSAVNTCHHRALAERLAEQDGSNPARRQAAEMLACFYEQARYAPADGPLSLAELTDARHALCYLAGVTAA